MFYDDVLQTAETLQIGEPRLPRYRKVPRRIDDGTNPHRYSDYFRHEACDLLITQLDQRFDQQQLLSPVLMLENLLLKAQMGNPTNHTFNLFNPLVLKFNIDQLRSQLPMCAEMIKQALPCVKHVTSVRTICEAMNANKIFKSMLSEIHNLLRLYLTIPITSSTSETSFSALRFVLTYLRSTMTESRLNNCLLPRIHKKITDDLEIAKEFIAVNSERKSHFGTYK